MTPSTLSCLVCASPAATVNRQSLNGCPRDVVICEACKQAVRLRQVGIARLKDGTLSVTDGREREGTAVA